MAQCSHPHYTLDLGLKENGKRNLKFVGFRADLSSLKQLEARYGHNSIVPLPCGNCLNCKINKAKEWAVRCVLEALEHEENYFITLTYDDQHLPKDGRLNKKDFQDFFKRFRNVFGPVRYFGCGEYGSKRFRPHGHFLLFGANIDDIKPNRFHQLESQKLNKVWSKGLISIGEVNYASANYVGQYCTKKIFTDSKDEFIMCSSSPGIGYTWCEKNIPKIFEYDKVFGSFGSTKTAKLPRYFEKVAERIDKGRFDLLKSARLNKDSQYQLNAMLMHQFEDIEIQLKYEQQITLSDFIARKRGKREDL